MKIQRLIAINKINHLTAQNYIICTRVWLDLDAISGARRVTLDASEAVNTRQWERRSARRGDGGRLVSVNKGRQQKTSAGFAVCWVTWGKCTSALCDIKRLYTQYFGTHFRESGASRENKGSTFLFLKGVRWQAGGTGYCWEAWVKRELRITRVLGMISTETRNQLFQASQPR